MTLIKYVFMAKLTNWMFIGHMKLSHTIDIWGRMRTAPNLKTHLFIMHWADRSNQKRKWLETSTERNKENLNLNWLSGCFHYDGPNKPNQKLWKVNLNEPQEIKYCWKKGMITIEESCLWNTDILWLGRTKLMQQSLHQNLKKIITVFHSHKAKT